MPAIALVLVVHDHQPVGNFDGVFQQAYDDAYAPFLAFLERHPRVRLGLHTSGPLLQWIALHQRDYLTRLRARVERGQVELWGGGFFEPVLPAIPEADRRGQILAMADWLELELGQRPNGLWLTERVWEPSLPSSLAPAGVRYTAVDDAHFVAAGFERDQLWGVWQTEDQGQVVKILPIHRELRYLIPFGEPEQVIELLRRVAAGGDGRIAVLGDDGEKFGVWPGTHALCYERGWLERFAEALEANPWIEVQTPAEAIAAHPPLGLCYLPSASYHEMQEWALPPEAQARYHHAAQVLAHDFGADAADLLRGGHWRNFVARYPESNRIHKRVLRASRLLGAAEGAGGEAWKAARTHLWRAECNCPYWHGVFGGLYLPHLRSAVERELIEAERYLGERALDGGRVRIERGDLDLDGFDDALLETPAWAAWITARGGALWGFDDRLALWNYGDTLTRRPEFYHRRLREAEVGGGEGHTIHAAIRLKEPGLAQLVEHYDPHPRDSFLETWTPNGGGPQPWAGERFLLADEPDGVALAIGESHAPALEKRYRAQPDGALEVELALTSAAACAGALAVELNLGLHVPQADDRYVTVDGARAAPPHFAARATHEAVREAAFVDQWAGRRLSIAVDRPARLTRAPIETVSLSEAGAERVFQGVETRWSFPVAAQANETWRVRFRLSPGRP
ncbi:MAG TPA: alpha-amylase/4-alpha-glucanotransferase domain-containing protein [Candidatus Eisenbacteria bacterium]|nr:alpha-amylase/4-alpha-glucanotransferase domain-containing protein [Candidatus Eisenbacteria bacterium]